MLKRPVLWIAFVLVHALVAVLGWWWPNEPAGDVYLVYEGWATNAVTGHGIVGVTEPFVYPVVALVPMVLAKGLAWIAGYTVGWVVMVSAIDAAAFAILLGRGASRPRMIAAAFWLAFLLALGPIALYRIDAVTVPIAILGLLWLARRPAVAGAVLAIATWIKVWPAALLLAAFIAVRRRIVLALSAFATSVAVCVVVIAMGGIGNLFGFVGEQTGRGLQVEAPVSAVYLWQTVLGVDGSFVYYDRDLLTFQATGANVDVVIAIMTPLLALSVAGLSVLGTVKAARGAPFVRLAPPLALGFVLVLIVLNKVGSPQFECWLIPPLVWWIVLDRRAARLPATLGLVVAALTQLVYPLTYGGILGALPFPVAILTVRNLLLVVLLIVVVTRLAALPTPAASVARRRAAIATLS